MTLTSADAEKPYDGTALTNDTVTVSGDKFVKGEGATYDVTGGQTDVGTSGNTFTYTLNENTNADNYTITTKEGTLKVTPVTDKVTVTITGRTGGEKYNGKEQTVSGYDVSTNNQLYTANDFEFTGTAEVKGTDAGSYQMGLKASDFKNISKNFTNVEFVVIDGHLDIAKRKVTLTSENAEKPYDGKALTNATVTVDGDGFVEGEGATYNVTGSQTEEGTSNNTFTYTLNEGTKADNYEITPVEGKLTVTANEEEVVVTITGHTGGEKYNGKEQTVSGYDVSTNNELYTAKDFTFSGTAKVKGTDAGTYEMGLKASDFANTSKNFKKVTFVVTDGSLTIDKRDVTLTSANASRAYTGNALTNDQITESGDGFVEGEGATYNVTGSQTNVGKSDNEFTYELNKNTKEKNYNITPVKGELEVTPVTEEVVVKITGHTGGEKYTGNKQTVSGYDVGNISNSLYAKENFKLKDGVKAEAEGTDADTYEMGLTGASFENVSKNFSNVRFEVTDGSLTIGKREVTLTSADAEKPYDGKALTNDTVTVSGDKFVKGEGATYDVTGSQTNAGESDNTFTYTLNGNTKEQNYTITSKAGTLKVTPLTDKVTVTIKENSGKETYNGKEKTVTGYKVKSISNNLYKAEDFTFKGNATVTAKDAGSYDMDVKASDFTNISNNFTDVTFIVEDGQLVIERRKVTLTSADDEKPYDGTALTNDTVTVSGDGFVEGEGATYKVTGSQTVVGTSDNNFTYKLNAGTDENNYDIEQKLGTLEVIPNATEVIVKITGHTGGEKYNGTAQKVTGYDIDINNPLYTEDDFEFTGNAVVEETDAGTYNMGLAEKNFKNISKNFSNVRFEVTDGALTIAKRDLTLTAGSKEKVYDGNALTDDTVNVSGDGFAQGDQGTYEVTGSQTWVGQSDNAITKVEIKSGKKNVKDNYNITLEKGTLTVTDGTPENPVTPSLVVNKTHDTDKTYKAGDVITFTITVKNIYDEAKTITLEEQEGVTLDKTTFENVKPGKEITASAAYTVTEADIVNGTFTNNVKATFSGVDKEYTGTDTVDKFEESRPHMTITKVTKDVGEDHIYKLGETINYVITVKNDGNLTLTNVKIEDALTGNAGENAWTIDTFAPGETRTFETSYVVTEADVIAGKVVNNATGEAENPDPKKEETPVTPGEKEDPVETPNPGLTVVKTSDAEGQVTLGQKITYTITVTNNGNVTISGVKLDDSLTGDNWTLGNIKPGETVTKKTTYTVTEKDIIAGKVENHATATGKEPGGKDITGEGEKTVTTEESNPQITVTKETTSTPKNGKTYALGEKITYKITAKNTGNLTLTDVTVSDKLTGNTGDKAFKIDGKFKPGEEATFEASYTVKESDLGKTVVNEATAAGKTTDPKNPEPGVTPGTTEDPVDQKNPAMTITKKVTDKKEEYQIGDTVKYEITVKNTGNTTQNNVLVEDRMNAAGSAVITKVEGAKGTIDGANVTLDTLAPGKEATITAEYTVEKEDRGNTITNAAVAKGEGETPVTPEVPVDVEDVYDIHVTHVFADGEESSAALPEDYDIENLKPGTMKLLNAEEVSGYTAYPAAERVTIEEEDVTVTFVYYKDAIGTDPANPDQPDNIPDRYQAVVKFEAVNGTVNIDHAVVTLFDENNEPAENGVGHLSLLQIANATADAGYDQSSLSWAPETPTIRYEITGEMTFTASFTATPATPGTTPANPTNPTPATPATPANPAPSTPANQTPARSTNIITRAAEAIADGAERIASDVRELLNNDDEDVPLAKQKLDDHKCCILHFLIMLLAAILYGFYTHNMKKRQKKMFEAREELDLELARRGLPTTKEQEQM